MKHPVFISLGLALLVTAWMLSGSLAAPSDPQTARPTTTTTVKTHMRVSVTDSSAQQVAREVVAQGQLEPFRSIQVRAETEGQAVRLPFEKGTAVASGNVLVVLATANRPLQLAKADAEVASRKLQLAGVRELEQKGYQAKTKLKAAEASLAAARAERERIRLDLERTKVRAPFDGFIEDRPVEIGSLVEHGDVVAEIVDTSQIRAAAQIPQQSVAKVALGQAVSIRLLDGRTAQGQVTYIAGVAENATRSFRVEVIIPNQGNLIKAGVSAELRIDTGRLPAHFISPALLILDDLGRIGVMSIDEENIARFHTVELVRTEVDGVWVSGLPRHLKVISQGQGFVAVGEMVLPTPST